jgi:ComF family protein
MKNLLIDLFHTLFPDLCLACNKLPKSKGASFCVECIHSMPYTDHFFIKENTVTNHFKGRVKLYHGAAILQFREGSIVQNMLHQLKYKGRREIGEVMGKIAGEKMLNSPLYIRPDIIIPVPVHIKKVKKRGYNQSTIFGLALAECLGLSFRDDILVKSVETASQTGKSRTERVNNVSDVFEIKDNTAFTAKHVLIVDDVITTGATLEACCMSAISGGARQISILCIAAVE